MTYKYMMTAAIKQSAIEMNCRDEDFFSNENKITASKADLRARKYYSQPFSCNFVSYGNNVVASANDELIASIRDYIGCREWYHCFETPAVCELNDIIRPLGYSVKYMGEYFLPDPQNIPDIECQYETRRLVHDDFKELYLPQWSNALCEKRHQLDVMGVGAYDNGVLIGMAACSADCENMYQIGVDVLPQYRRMGVASALTSRLTKDILVAGKIPFYCAAWSNIRSVKNALSCGFKPSWIELSVAKTN